VSATSLALLVVMAMWKRKILSAYIFLVGLPLLALMGILRAGAQLTPPKAIRGTWLVDADFSSPSAHCAALWTDPRHAFLTITQSGRDVTVTFNGPGKIVLFGTLRGSALLATPLSLGPDVGPPSSGCEDPRLLRFLANVQGQGEQQALAGMLTWGEGAGSPQLPFRALRQMPPERSGQ
jgi:hypothetical protein